MTDTDMLIAQRNALAKVVSWCWDEARAGCDITGADFQTSLAHAGLVAPHCATAEEAEMYECDEGDIIYRPSALFSDALKAAKS